MEIFKTLLHPTETYIQEQTEKIKRDALETLQVMEFNGKLYIAYDGVPIISADLINMDLPEALIEARETYGEYKISRLGN